MTGTPNETLRSEPVVVPTCGVRLYGDLVVPERAGGLVLFAHGSGSSRYSPRNRFVAAALERRGLATLLMDLLTPDEEAADARSGEYPFDIPRPGRDHRLAATRPANRIALTRSLRREHRRWRRAHGCSRATVRDRCGRLARRAS
jgi:hypothetical protein